jgi:DNA repair protein RadA/Sms
MKLDVNLKELDHCTNIMELEVPPELDVTVPSGVDWIDAAMGGEGFTPSTAMLFTGDPGAGKTTTLLRLADSVTATGNVCLYNMGEESPLQVRKVVRRLGLKHGFYIGQDEMTDDIITHAKKIMGMKKNKGKQLFLIQDSMQTANDGKYGVGATNGNTQLRVTEALTDFAKCKPFPIVIMVGHVTKGNVFAGKQQVKHAMDVHAHLHVDMKEKSETYGYRLFEVQKNRFGCTGVTFILQMEEKGLKEVGTMQQFVSK